MNRKYFIAAAFGGISLGMASSLLAASAWLLSMASLRPPILTLEVAIVAVRFFGLSRGIFRYLERLTSHDAAFSQITKTRIEIFEKFLKIPFVKLREFSRASVLQRLTKGIERQEDLYLRIITPWLSSLIAGISGLSILIYLVPKLGIYATAIFLTLSAVLPVIGFFSSQYYGQRLANEDGLSLKVVTAIESRDEALIYNYADTLVIDVSNNVKKLKKLDSRESILSGIGISLITWCSGATSIIAIYFTYTEVLTRAIGGVNFAVAILLPLAIFDAASTLPNSFALIGDVLHARQELRMISKFQMEESVNRAKYDLEATQLTVAEMQPRWNSSMIPLVKISMILERGNAILLKGKSGIGKSSIAYALAGLLDYSGSAQIDGIEVKLIEEDSLNRLITLASQSDYLFATSIRENLKIGNPEASDERLFEVLKILELDILVNSLPYGLDTHVGARGLNFSGGEQRRLLLARAMLRHTPFVILDEPFEYLDQDLIQRISPRIIEHFSTAGVIIISHLPIDGLEHIVNL